MAFLPGIFGRQAQQQPAAAQQQAAPQTSAPGPAGTQTAAPANGQIAAQMQTGQMQTAPQQAAGGPQPGPASALDAFTGFFKPAAPAAGQKAPGIQDPFLQPLDQAQFQQQVQQANFTRNIPAETVQKALSGDPQAFMDAINAAAREAFAASAQLSHGLSEQAARTGVQRLDGSLDGRIKNYQLRTQNTNNEALNHPAVAPMVQAMRQQFAQANPNLSPAEIQTQVEQYFDNLSGVLQSSKTPTAEQQAAKSADKPADFSYLLQ